MPDRRRAVAAACIALVVVAAFLPLGGVSLDWLVVTPAFVLLPPAPVPALPRRAPRAGEQTLALLATLDSRGPPVSSSLA